MLRSCSWPARIERVANGVFHVRPLHLPACEGTGKSRKEAIEAAREALTRRLAKKVILLPPLETLDPKDIRSGTAVRIDVEFPE